MSDAARIAFVINRDSREDMLSFVKQCRTVYSRANLASKRKFGKTHAYRLKFIRSYLFHKRYLEAAQ